MESLLSNVVIHTKELHCVTLSCIPLEVPVRLHMKSLDDLVKTTVKSFHQQ